MKKRGITAAAVSLILAGTIMLSTVPALAEDQAEDVQIMNDAEDLNEDLTVEELEENRWYYENDGEALSHLNPDGTWIVPDEVDEEPVGDSVSEQLVHDARFKNYIRHYGVDVSYYSNQDSKEIDWEKVKAAGREFAIVRIGYRTYGSSGAISEDKWWKKNLTGAIDAGLQVGVYIYSQAITKAEAQEEADWLMNKVSAYQDKITMGYVMDYEYADKNGSYIGRLADANLTKAQKTAYARAFCERVTAKGLHPMIYADSNFLTNSLNASELDSTYDIWMARYRKAGAEYSGNYKIWQYSASIEVDGIPAKVCDVDVWYEKPTVTIPDQPEDEDYRIMYRFYNPNNGEHFYTKSKVEAENLVSYGWNYEGIGWYAPTTSDTPVYRLYNPNEGDHHYTTSELERDNLVKIGWNYEGIGWYSASKSSGIPLYRLFNPNARTGSHHYTRSTAERDYLDKIGWNYEGIGWYSVK